MSSVKSNGGPFATAQHHRLLCFAVLAHWRYSGGIVTKPERSTRIRGGWVFNGDQSVNTAAELLREALQVQQRALPECRHVWRCLCLEGVPQQNSGSFHDASFQREPRAYVTAACLRHNRAACVQLKAMARD